MARLLCVEGLVAAVVTVSVPLSVDGLVSGNVDNLGLGLLGIVDLLLLGSGGDSSGDDLELGVVAVFGRGGDSAGSGLDLAGRGDRRWSSALLARGLSTAHVEVHVLVRLASLGLDVIGEDVRNLVARGGIVARHDRAPSVGGCGLYGASLGTSDQVVTLLPGGAVGAVGRTVNVGNIEVVEVEAGRVFLDEVLQLGDVVALALLGLGDLDRDTNIPALGISIVLLVGLARLEGDHLVTRTSIALVDRPKVYVVSASVVNTGHGLAGVALRVEGDCAPCRGSCDHRGRDRKDSNELHFG